MSAPVTTAPVARAAAPWGGYLPSAGVIALVLAGCVLALFLAPGWASLPARLVALVALVAAGRRILGDRIGAYFKGPASYVGLFFLVLFMVLALFAPELAPQNPYDLNQIDFMDGVLAPGSASMDGSLTYHLGTDKQGRDIWSAILYGLRLSLIVAVTSTLTAMLIGMAVGVWSAWAGGRVDAVLMRIVDLQLSFPTILVALMLMAAFGSGVDKVILALIIVQWAYYARTVRGAALSEARKEYIDAARGLGLPAWRILLRHLLPNCIPPLIVISTVQVANTIVIESSLSYLGVGVPITQPSLGMLIATGFDYMLSGQYWMSMFPGVALLGVVAAINLVGDRLRDILNPRLRR
ncbi:ABC transporter permease [Paracoccus sp. (in: a-proteobacteria)]|uniref:ABC transporter permease n=1 Tax=Paracoccus sp. TaxID=267 RepID=UPI0026E00093|nr:ABC transporter permease [Paracoccus sp. (in: a-proteobacteria)]MDO5648791.1 ABC transporter permease [Paracoccus sp. (in: a-proteobacteria)]